MKNFFLFISLICISKLSAQTQVSNKDELVNTPGGPIKKSNVHHVEKGCYLKKENGRIKKINAKTGIVVQEYDVSQTNTSTQKLRTTKNQQVTQVDSTFGSAWVTYSDWTNNSGSPISYFNTNWIVPNPPTTFNNQTIYLFNGIEPSDYSEILQPVLQWGSSAAGGGNYWTITNWYVGGSNAFFGDSLIKVNPGDNLQGVMKLTANTGSGYSYNSAFIGHPSCSLQVNNVAELTWANETMEVYGITGYTDYPPDTAIRMTNIQILTGTVTPALNWTPQDVVTDVGQHTIVVSNNSTNGEVDLYFHNPPKQVDVGIPTVVLSNSNCNDTINLSMKLKNYGIRTITTCSVNYKLDNASPITQTWNGSLATAQTVLVSFPSFTAAVGSHTLTCYSSNPNDSIDQESLNNTTITYFNVISSGSLPIVEGFETSTCPSGLLPNSNWNTSHSSTGGLDFQITSLAAASGSKSCVLNNFSNVAADTSILETNAKYDLTTVSSPILTFDAAYQKASTTNADKLQILTSTDCGISWQSRRVITGTTLASLGGISSNPYVPNSSQFTTYTVNINAVANSHKVMFSWKFYADPNGPGNNLYIDNINIAGTVTGIQNIEELINLNVYPNPSSGNVHVNFNLSEKHAMAIYVNDVLGRVVETINTKYYDAGETNLNLGSDNIYQRGIYTINIDIDGQHIIKKIIIQ